MQEKKVQLYICSTNNTGAMPANAQHFHSSGERANTQANGTRTGHCGGKEKPQVLTAASRYLRWFQAFALGHFICLWKGSSYLLSDYDKS